MWTLVELLKVNLTIGWGSLWLGLLEFFNSNLSTLSLLPLVVTLEVFLPWHCFLWWFPLRTLCSGNLHFPLFASPILGAAVCPVSSPLSLDPRGIVAFSVCSAFYLLGSKWHLAVLMYGTGKWVHGFIFIQSKILGVSLISHWLFRRVLFSFHIVGGFPGIFLLIGSLRIYLASFELF